jgi:hypothetical protein
MECIPAWFVVVVVVVVGVVVVVVVGVVDDVVVVVVLIWMLVLFVSLLLRNPIRLTPRYPILSALILQWVKLTLGEKDFYSSNNNIRMFDWYLDLVNEAWH